MSRALTRLTLGLIWLAHFLPFRAIAAIGDALGVLAFWLIAERRRVTRINLEKCFPHMDPRARERLARAHFRAFSRSLVDRGVLWWGTPERIRRFVHLEGAEHLHAASAERVVILAPHFLGLDAGGSRLSLDISPAASLYSRQKDPAFDRFLVRGRGRFGVRLFPRQAGLRTVLREVRAGARFYYLPDMDLGARGSVFVPFFGVPAATTIGLSYIARATGAKVVPCVTRMLPRGGYAARVYPAWSDFPSGNDVADARRMLAFIEERVREMPEQYLWMHKRFKTRPEGEEKFY